ncbi:hypothetical protein BH09SUM1_BH09SUM1_28080 [soil metagenome]
MFSRKRNEHLLATLGAIALIGMATSSASAQFVPGSLKAYWKMNESNPAVTTVADLSGNGNVGTFKELVYLPFFAVNGPVMNTNGPTVNVPNAAEFDGSNDVLYVASNSGLDFDKTRGSISFWINSDLDNRMSILRTVSGTAYSGISIEKSGSSGSAAYRIFFTLGSGPDFMVSTLPTNNVWQHYVFAWDYTETDNGNSTLPARVRCYVNGVQTPVFDSLSGQDSTFLIASKPADAVGNWIWGQRYLPADVAAATTRPLDGELAEIAIFDNDLDATAAMDIYTNGVSPSASNLVALYTFSEGSGTAIADHKGTANMFTSEPPGQGYISNQGPTFAGANPTGRPSFISRALQFDGVNDCVTVPDSATLDFTKDKGTIVMWTYLNSNGRANLLGDTGGALVAQVSSSARMAFRTATSSDFLQTTVNPVVGNTWAHYAFVFDQSQPAGTTAAPNRIKVYRNDETGLLVNSTANLDTTYSSIGTTADWVIGRKEDLLDTTNPRWVAGQMAEVAIFDVPLSGPDITAIVTNGVSAFAGITSVSDWTLLDDK